MITCHCRRPYSNTLEEKKKFSFDDLQHKYWKQFITIYEHICVWIFSWLWYFETRDQHYLARSLLLHYVYENHRKHNLSVGIIIRIFMIIATLLGFKQHPVINAQHLSLWITNNRRCNNYYYFFDYNYLGNQNLLHS